jgi:hypothetical protein
MTRNGKIARLPREVREELNRRLENGEPANGLAVWLNGLPEVRQVLQAQFGGRAINDNNVSEWKGGGYREWQEQQEKRGLLRQTREEARELAEATDGAESNRELIAVLTADLALTVREGLRELTNPKERREWLLKTLGALARLRREDHVAAHLAIKQERWQQEKTKKQERVNLAELLRQTLPASSEGAKSD